MRFIRNTFIALAILFLSSCANKIAPSGGPTDTEPPVFLSSNPANKSLNIKPKKIDIRFNEFIELDNPSQQILISPPLKNPPKFLNNGKSIRVILSDTLKNEVTYNINFGKAVRDNHEANVLNDFNFVFSTGQILDSLELSGTILKQEDGSPAADYYCLLFNDKCDTCLYSQRPDYFAISNQDGLYRIRNLHPGIYTLYFLKDENFNYIKDLNNERVGFYPSLISIQDTNQSLFKCFTFKERSVTNGVLSVDQSGFYVTNISFQKPVKNIFLNSNVLDMNAKAIFNSNYDTLTYIHTRRDLDSFLLYIKVDSMYSDTLSIIREARGKELKPVMYPFSDTKNKKKGENARQYSHDISASLNIKFNMPVTLSDESLIHLYLDSQKVSVPFTIKQSKDDYRKFILQTQWAEKSTYKLVVDKGAFLNPDGDSCDESVEIFTTRAADDYGSIILTNFIKSTFDDYKVRVKNDLGQIIYSKRIKTTDNEITVSNLPEGYYKVEVLEDKNHNGELDPGNLIEKVQPERLYTMGEKLQLKAGWELEVKIQIENK